MNEARVIEKSFHVTKLKLLEVFPLYPFLHGREKLDVIEVGANTGLWCEAFHDVFGHRIRSYRAFEPMPGNLAQFERRLAQHMPTADVELVAACAGASAGDVTIHYDKDVTTLASVVVSHMKWRNLTIDNSHEMVVPQVRLDDVLTEPVDLVKVDTEGYEWDVIAGMTGAIDDGRVDNVFFEFGGHQGHLGQSFRQFWDYFESRGWRLFRQTVSRNYFGLNEIAAYDERLEDFSSMWMILASRVGPSEGYHGPRVVGRWA